MKKIVIVLAFAAAAVSTAAQTQPEVSSKRFADAVSHWNKEHGKQTYERYTPDQFRGIADNIVAYQNADGGWPKNLDMMAKLDPDSVKASSRATGFRRSTMPMSIRRSSIFRTFFC